MAQIILYDGECGLCNAIIRFIRKRDPEQKFSCIPLQSQEGQRSLTRVGLPATDFSSVVYIRNGRHYLKSTAALKILRDMGGLWKFLYLFMIVPRPVRDWVYHIVSVNRKRLGFKRS